MTIEQAQQELAVYRKQQREARKKIVELRTFLQDRGVNPDPSRKLTERNNAIYQRRQAGERWSSFAAAYNISPQRVARICEMIYWETPPSLRYNDDD